MRVEDFVRILDVEFYTGVPDSQLKALCNYLDDNYGISKNHIIAANEGNAVALAAGYHLATDKIPVIYMQNSGIGNTVNPLVSLMNDCIYGIPSILIIGWRGEPGVKDEPQHKFQGMITLDLLKTMDIEYFILEKDTSVEEAEAAMDVFNKAIKLGKTVAFVVKKDSLSYEGKKIKDSQFALTREEAIEGILTASGNDVIVSTTGKASREVFEIRERHGNNHEKDFLTVGSMGHASSIATTIAIYKKQKRVWCIDGDGAAIMHMGAMATLGSMEIDNIVHVLVNNFSHETVGGMPTVSKTIEWGTVAKAVGYDLVYKVDCLNALEDVLTAIKKEKGKIFLEVVTNQDSRKDLGRPTTSTKENKEAFTNYLKKN